MKTRVHEAGHRLDAASSRSMNDMPFELHVALRYLLAKRKQAFISVISLISTLGVTVGVMALVIALALMTGPSARTPRPHRRLATRTSTSGTRAASTTTTPRPTSCARFPHVVGAAPAILGQGLISASRDTQPIMIKGIDPALEQEVTDIKGAMLSGSIEALDAAGRRRRRDGILLGKDLAAKLGVEVGDTVSVLTPQGTLTPNGLMPRPRRLRVAGIFCARPVRVRFDVRVRVDRRREAAVRQGPGRSDPAARGRHLRGAPRGRRSDPRRFGSDYLTQDWSDMNRSLFSALSLEKMAISLTIGLIVMVAALNIVASLILLVMEKHRDIAILKTMGASARSVTTIFMMQGLIIGIVGHDGRRGGRLRGCRSCSIATR